MPRPGDRIPRLALTPDAGVTRRYAEASGDHNPIHTDEELARSVGLPGVILHGLYTMAQVARAVSGAVGGDPRSLKRLAVRFRGFGFPGHELTISGTVTGADASRVLVEAVAEQSGRRIVRGAEAELESPSRRLAASGLTGPPESD